MLGTACFVASGISAWAWAAVMLGTACFVASRISAWAWATPMLGTACFAASGISARAWAALMLGSACFLASGISARAWAALMLGTACFVASGISARAWAALMLGIACFTASGISAGAWAPMLGTACSVASGRFAKVSVEASARTVWRGEAGRAWDLQGFRNFGILHWACGSGRHDVEATVTRFLSILTIIHKWESLLPSRHQFHHLPFKFLRFLISHVGICKRRLGHLWSRLLRPHQASRWQIGRLQQETADVDRTLNPCPCPWKDQAWIENITCNSSFSMSSHIASVRLEAVTSSSSLRACNSEYCSMQLS